MKFAIGLIVFFVSIICSAQTPIPYYGEEFYNSSNLSGPALQKLLHRIVSEKHQVVTGKADKLVSNCESGSKCYQHTNIGYEEAKQFLLSKYYVTQSTQGFTIKDVYCEENYNVPGPSALPDANIINVEHTWPQSLFTGRYDKKTQKADLHHLYPSDSVVNSIRGNYPFGVVAKEEKNLKCNASRFGIAQNDSEMVFEPPKEHRGNVARALFYFSIRYEMPIDEKQEAFLREWHKADPVDNDELKRNEEIFKTQGNRNPFIDMPELVDRIENF